MEGRLPRAQSLPRLKPSSASKWDSGLSKSTKVQGKFSGPLSSVDRRRSELGGKVKYYSGELPQVPRHAAPAAPSLLSTSGAKRDASTNTDGTPMSGELTSSSSGSFGCESVGSNARELKDQPDRKVGKNKIPKDTEAGSTARYYSPPVSRGSSIGARTTSIQTEKEGSDSRLLSRGGESSSFRGRQLSSSSRRESASFRLESTSISFRNEPSLKRKERKGTKSFQDGDVSSVASESVQGSPCSIHYNQAPFSSKGAPVVANVAWSSSPSSPEVGPKPTSVAFKWEDAPGKAKTIAAAAEMALARKIAKDESLRKNAPALANRNHGSSRSDKSDSTPPPRGMSSDENLTMAGLSLPPSKKVSQEFPFLRKDLHSSQLIVELKAAVMRKQAEEMMASTWTKTDVEDDLRSVISDFSVGEAHIDLVAPSAAKFLNRVDDQPAITPVKTPLAAVPFKWEEAPGKAKDFVSSPSRADPPQICLPPRLLSGSRSLSKEQQAKILSSYSSNTINIQCLSSGNPTPVTRSRESTPTRRDRTPTRREVFQGLRDTTPTKRDSTPTRNSFPPRTAARSGPVALPPLIALPTVRNSSGPLRSNTGPNYLNVPPKCISQELARVSDSQELARVSQEDAISVLTRDLERCSSRPSSENGPSFLYSQQSSRKLSQELLQIVPFKPPSSSGPSSSGSSKTGSVSRASDCHEMSEVSVEDCRAVAKSSPATEADPLSPTSILCGPDMSSQRSTSNLSSAYAESSQSQHEEFVSGHKKSESCTSVESFEDGNYQFPPPWGYSDVMNPSPYGDLGPVDKPTEPSQGNKNVDDGFRAAVVKFCKSGKSWNKFQSRSRRNSGEQELWTPAVGTYIPKMELCGSILSKVGSQVFPEAKELKMIGDSGHLSVPCSPLKFPQRAGDITYTPEHHLAARRPLGSMTPVHVITTCRSPSYRVLATDECFSVLSPWKVWNGTKAKQLKWSKKMKRSSHLMAAVFASLKRSMVMKCGRDGLQTIHSERNLLQDETDVPPSKEQAAHMTVNTVHSLTANHQFHRPL